MKFLTISISLVSILRVNFCSIFEPPAISTITDFFSMKRVLLIGNFKEQTNRSVTDLYKNIDLPFRVLTNLEMVTPKDLLSNNFIINAQEFSVKETLNFLGRGLHLTSLVIDDHNQVRKASSIEINERIYFLDPQTNLIIESYVTSSMRVERILAKLRDDASGQPKITPIENRAFLERRSNFMGHELKVVTDFYKPYLVYQTEVPVEHDPHLTSSGDKLIPLDEQHVSGLVGQLFFDVLRTEMNFTTKTFMRSDRKWGYYVDGKWDGMVSTNAHLG